ncbi:PTS sugar transporter subunit IIB [uncultured Vagococcus sp.]|uniref:PTS sugar transporter subunit IIB n=1 Tax=uncultured Vagococcus sp. TaxID=189676 RepID=UPI0028D02132|nr:PTS sugar transporter subunit IIB [uncultured Vagococcus sp.]
MTYRIMLACAGGMSTSLLASSMRKAAEEMGIDITVAAMPVGNVASVRKDIDILLIGPQVRYQLPQVEKIYQQFPVTVQVIDSLDYGRMLGGKVLGNALTVYQREHGLN